ncbi:penicillin-binding protein, partial [Yersinia pestis]
MKYEQIPPEFIHAFLAAEDSSFFEHSGISFKSLGRALSETVTGSDVQTGGSTITMQVAKNYYLSPERTLKRKLTEIFLARKIEQNLSKEEILTLYVNKIFLGEKMLTVSQQQLKFNYNKSLEDLSTAQMAMIS